MTEVLDSNQKIKCYIINLDRSSDRLEQITQIFNEQGLSFERVAAVDGSLLSEEEFKRHSKEFVLSRKLTRPELGCFLSHRECLRRIIEDTTPWAAVFEDDILLSPNISTLLHDQSWIPKNTDIVKLDTAKIVCTVSFPNRINFSNHLHFPYRLGQLLSRHYGTGGYIVSRESAKKLYEKTEFVTVPIDEIYFNPDLGLLNELNVQQIIPAVIIQREGIESTIDEQRQYQHKKQEKKSKNKQREVHERLAREVRRTYRRKILPLWQAVTRGYRTGKINFH